jgi:putative lipoic acid-binding regulatory protein
MQRFVPDGPPAARPLDPSAHLELDYPCAWTYTLIGSDEAVLFEVARRAAGACAHRLERSRRSKSGRYVSITLELVVRDEAQRLSIFDALRGSTAVRYVL